MSAYRTQAATVRRFMRKGRDFAQVCARGRGVASADTANCNALWPRGGLRVCKGLSRDPRWPEGGQTLVFKCFQPQHTGTVVVVARREQRDGKQGLEQEQAGSRPL